MHTATAQLQLHPFLALTDPVSVAVTSRFL